MLLATAILTSSPSPSPTPAPVAIETQLSPEAARRLLERIEADERRLKALERFRGEVFAAAVDTVGMGVCGAADMWTTGRFRGNPRVTESNPLIGSGPGAPEQHVALKSAFLGVAALGDYALRATGHRKLARTVAVVTCAGFVGSAAWNTALEGKK